MSIIAEIHKDLEQGMVRLMAEYRDCLFAEAVRLCNDASLAEDLVSRTFAKAIQKIDLHDESCSLAAWLKTILVNLYRDDLKNSVVRGTVPVDAETLEKEAGEDWSSDDQILANSDNEALRAAIGAVLSACSSLWDKYVFQVAASPIEPTQLVFQLGLVLVYALCLSLHHLISQPFSFRWSIPLVGILLAFSDFLMFNGVSIPGTPVSVAALLRRFSVAITFVLGAIFFHERNLQRKGFALGLVLTGIALLIF